MFNKIKEFFQSIYNHIKSWIHRETEYMKQGFWGLALFVVGAGTLGFIGGWFSNGISNFLSSTSSYPAIFGNVGIAMILFYIYDRWICRGVNTMKMMKDNPYLYFWMLTLITAIIVVSIAKS